MDASENKSVWVVEDLLSKQRLNQKGITCIALLGTRINEALEAHLQDHYDSVYLALDNDATAKAVKYKSSIGAQFRNFIVVPLSKDIKNMKDNELDGLLATHTKKEKNYVL